MLLFCDWKRKSTERKEKKNLPFFCQSVLSVEQKGYWKGTAKG